MTDGIILVPADVRRFIEGQSASAGRFTVRWSAPDLCGMVIAVGGQDDDLTAFPAHGHFVQFADSGPIGRWFAGTEELTATWKAAMGRGGAIPVESMRERLPAALLHIGPGMQYYAIVVSPSEGGTPVWTGWIVRAEDVIPVRVDVERDDEGLKTLGERWPTDLLREAHVAVIGVGSIGSAAAVAIAEHGVGSITLVDPDRLEFHNLIRHQLGRADVGKFKAPALAEFLALNHPGLNAKASIDDVLYHTDSVRAILRDVDLVIGATDGVVPRRTIVHIARRLQKTALLGCVLMDGEIGEIMRCRPARTHGCVQCRRGAHLGLFTLDASLELPYGTGTEHLPMTAIGTDLELVGRLLAKSAIATILESAGLADQRLAGETAIIGLRPTRPAPAPYNITRSGEARWLPADPPQPGCPTCDP
jgi:molybdopterin/thiamine biosynthesis adenylyltransferase